MDLIDELANLLRLTFIQGAIAAFVTVAAARATLAGVGAWQRTRRPPVRITVVGVGGAGSNAVDAMVRARRRGVRFVALNTDRQALRRSLAHALVLVGKESLGGLGTGGDPAVAEAATTADADRIAKAVSGSDIVFVVAGLGGGTGSGVAPAVAAAARAQGALTVAVVTQPFAFEGAHRAAVATHWASVLREHVDALVAVPNDAVSSRIRDGASLLEAFTVLDGLVGERVAAIVDLIGEPGRVNLDSSHVRAAMQDGGDTVMGIGRGRGEQGALDAVREAMAGAQVPSGRGAARVLVHLAGSARLAFVEVTAATAELGSIVAPDANVIFGATFDRRLRNETVATVIATAFGAERRRASIGSPLRGVPAVAEPESDVLGEQDPVAAAASELDQSAIAPTPSRALRRPRRSAARTGTEG